MEDILSDPYIPRYKKVRVVRLLFKLSICIATMNNAYSTITTTNEKLSTIASINRGGQKVNLLGIVLHKSSIKRVDSKDGQQPCRGVFSFVLRDNLHSWINVNYWGSYKSAGELAASFSIGNFRLNKLTCLR